LLLAPVLVMMVYRKWPGIAIAFVILVAFISDVLDGVVARRLGVATPELRHLDSRVDLVFYATAAWAVWKLHPAVVRTIAVPALIVIGLDVTRHVFDFLKFGRDVAYHAWSSKAWGLLLAVAMVLLTGFDVAQPYVWLAVISGLIAQVDGLAISVILPTWTHDVPSFVHALKIRNNTLLPG
jgi:CDP-diacylglycerol--glycerol-3-phosphate 3-phosphatidyltransferase